MLNTTIKKLVELIKLFLIILLNLFHRNRKFIKYLWSGKHEIERICDSEVDIYEKTMQVDQWLTKTNCNSIKSFMREHFDATAGRRREIKTMRAVNRILSIYRVNQGGGDIKEEDHSMKSRRITSSNAKSHHNGQHHYINLEDHDTSLSNLLRELTQEAVRLVIEVKGLEKSTHKFRECLSDTLYRIMCYKMSIILAEQLASIKYDADLDLHTEKLISLWNNLVKADNNRESDLNDSEFSNSHSNVFPADLSMEISDKSGIVSNRWSHIGFQGEDPGTDFRGMGVLGLAQLEYLSRKPKRLAADLLKRSLHDKYGYPFAIVGINITYNLLNLFKDGSMKHLYYDEGDVLFRNSQRALKLLTTLHDLYVELFLRFDCFWFESKPETIFEFKPLMEKFVSIMRWDLCTRNFSMKFMY